MSTQHTHSGPYMSWDSFSRSLSRVLSWRREGMGGGGGGGAGDGGGSRGPRVPGSPEGLLARGLWGWVLGGGWAMVGSVDML